MTDGRRGPVPYIHFPGTAREALEFYADVFGGRAQHFTFGQFSRTDGPADHIAHGEVTDCPVALFGADAVSDNEPTAVAGLMLSLLGTAPPATLHSWFDRLAEDGTVIDPLAVKPWGAFDGQVVDRFGLHWLLGYETEET